MTDIATGQALLQAILDDPDNDAVRLVYADWLEEYGDDLPRAEFIRVQVELMRCGQPYKFYDRADSFSFWRRKGSVSVEGKESANVGDRIDFQLVSSERQYGYKGLWQGVLVTEVYGRFPRQGIIRSEVAFVMDEKAGPWKGEALQRRERELFQLGDVRGDLPLPYRGKGSEVQNGYYRTLCDPTRVEIQALGGQKDPPVRFQFVWRRGFISSVSCTCDDFLRHAAAIFAAQPVQHVWLTDKQPLWTQTVPPLNRWICYSHHPTSYEYVLPPILFEQLLPDPNCLVVRDARLDIHPGDSCDYVMPEHANAGLSRACVRLGRKLAREARRDPA